jgi:hypothetical protein
MPRVPARRHRQRVRLIGFGGLLGYRTLHEHA